MTIVTLLTDYGLIDTYVGQLKGALLRVAPSSCCVDLTHQVPAQDVRAGAFLLWSAVEAFPPGTVHLAVVDPGVGSSRKPIGIRTGNGSHLVGPDNGLLIPAAHRLGGMSAVVELSRPEFWGPARSSTFHGRDVFAPVAGHLAHGTPLEQVGGPLSRVDVDLEFPEPMLATTGIHGQVLHVDGFGNLVTNITGASVAPGSVVVVGSTQITDAPIPSYAATLPGAALAYVGSSGLLEIAIRNGSAQEKLDARPGTPVEVRRPG